MTTTPDNPAPAPNPPPQKQPSVSKKTGWFTLILVIVALGAAGITALLVNIFQRKQEARNLWVRKVDVIEATTDPKPWGINWAYEYDGYKRTAEVSRTNFGGGDADPAEKSKTFPWLTRAFAGYAFSLSYKDRRGHFYMLSDQEKTRRVIERPQPGACLHCHSSITPTYRRLGAGNTDWDKVRTGFIALSKMSYQDAHKELFDTGTETPTGEVNKDGTPVFKHADGVFPVSCVDCHDPNTMDLRVTRPGFIMGIAALADSDEPVPQLPSVELWRSHNKAAIQNRRKRIESLKSDAAKQGKGVDLATIEWAKNELPYDPNKEATRQEMRSFVCAQCHVEYYCGPKTTLFFPWGNGLKVQEAEAYYDNHRFPDGTPFLDWAHAETGARMLKAQHPEFEMFNQGIHARSGVACADCHMPYERKGALKVSDHWVRSPLKNINRACQTCHHFPESELASRVNDIQQRNYHLMQDAGTALVDFLGAFKPLREPFDPANRAAAETKARDALAKDAAYAKLPADEQQKKLAATTQTNLNEMWAAEVAKTPELKTIADLHRKAQWRLDFVAAENSMGFHAPQEAARILGESINLFRQAQIASIQLLQKRGSSPPTTRPGQ